MANQVATGLALSLFGVGLSAFVGLRLRQRGDRAASSRWRSPACPTFRSSASCCSRTIRSSTSRSCCSRRSQWFLYRTRAGLIAARGRRVAAIRRTRSAIRSSRIRYLAVLFGGACAGLARRLSRGRLHAAVDRGHDRRPRLDRAGAGRVRDVEAAGACSPARTSSAASRWRSSRRRRSAWRVPSQFLSMLPYLATIVVLAIISRDAATIRLNAPASLGKPFHPDA